MAQCITVLHDLHEYVLYGVLLKTNLPTSSFSQLNNKQLFFPQISKFPSMSRGCRSGESWPKGHFLNIPTYRSATYCSWY